MRAPRKLLSGQALRCMADRTHEQFVMGATLAARLDFVERKRREYERAVARHKKRDSSITWRMRLRIQMLSKFNSDALEIKTRFQGRRVIIRSRNKGESIKDAEGIVFIARRFKTPEAAAAFGFALQAAVSAIGVLRHIPLDVGFDNAPGPQFSDLIKDKVAKEFAWIVNDVHGVDIFPDTQTMMVSGIGGTASVAFNPSRLTDALEADGNSLANLDEKAKEASLLINAAFMAPHPVAMITLGVAAVELLAKSEKWSASQKAWIGGLRQHLLNDKTLTAAERAELEPALQSLNHFGALASTRRLFAKLDLGDLLERWEHLYRRRSRLFHGNDLLPASELQNLGSDAREISRAVFEAYINH